MTPSQILYLNAIATGGCAIAMLAARSLLYPLFGLPSPMILDVVAVGLLAYVVTLILAARRENVSSQALMTFAAVDGAWVLGSAALLVLFWTHLAPTARILIVLVAIVVEVFATLQFRASRQRI